MKLLRLLVVRLTTIISSLFCIGALILIMIPAGCATIDYNAMAQDPTKGVWITVQTVPPGADVYGLVNGKPGTCLGKTPLTLKYSFTGFDVLNGFAAEETTQVLTWYGIGPFEARPYTLKFRYYVSKQGFRPSYVMEEFVQRDPVEGIHRTFTAILNPE